MKFSVIPALFAVVSLVSANPVIPVPREAQDVFVPPILYPRAGTVWEVNQHYNVTWDISNAPAHITNSIGSILLRKDGIPTFSDPVLASNFSILLGTIEVQVPDITPGGDYQLVLFGDSGNLSPFFTITY